MSKPLGLLLAVVGSALAACTHIATLPDRAITETAQQAMPGATYSLPMLQYSLSLTRTLTSCPTEKTVGGVTILDPTLAFQVEATAKGAYPPGERYVVDYEALSSWFKTTDFALERYPSGTLKSLNASATDMTGDVLKDTVKTGILVASLGTGGPAAAAAQATLAKSQADTQLNFLSKQAHNKSQLDALLNSLPALQLQNESRIQGARSDLLQQLIREHLTTVKVIKCTQSAELATAARAVNRKVSKDKTKELAALNRKIADQSTLAGLKALDLDGRKALGALFAQQEQLIADLAQLDEDLGDIDKMLAVSQSELWPARFNDPLSAERPLSPEDQTKLAALLIPVTVRVIDQKGFAKAIEALTADQRLELIKQYPKELVGFINTYGMPLDPPAVLEDCQGPKAEIATCLAQKLRVSAALVRAETGRGPCPAAPGVEEECLRTLKPAPKTRSANDAAPSAKDPLIVKARDDIPDAGVFVRDPALAKLIVCRAKTCDLDSANLATVDVTYAPQLGQLRFLPFRNDVFESNALSVTLDEDGKLGKIEYKKDKSVAQVAAATAADVAGQVSTEKQRRAKERQDALTAARAEATAQRADVAARRDETLAELKSEQDILTAEIAIAKLKAPATPDEFAATNEEIAQKTKAVEILKARILLAQTLAAAEAAGVSTN